jgi:citrate lyase subunit beta / citryl-CoA lyase
LVGVVLRPLELCRSWLFVEGADEHALLVVAPTCGADVLVQDLEDFTPPELRGNARAIAPEAFRRWREAGRIAAVRVNPLAAGGMDDLAAVMRGAPDIVALPKVSEPGQVALLAAAVSRCEREYNLADGATMLLPNIELARGLVQTAAIVRASARVKACLIGSEDLAADLGAERGADGIELAYARQRFLVECVAEGALAVDCPYTWFGDADGLARDTHWARRLGYQAKSAVDPEHCAIINAVLTPTAAEIAAARAILDAFAAAQGSGRSRVEVGGILLEKPAADRAGRLIARAKALGEIDRGR